MRIDTPRAGRDPSLGAALRELERLTFTWRERPEAGCEILAVLRIDSAGSVRVSRARNKAQPDSRARDANRSRVVAKAS